MDLKPKNAVSITECDINLDFDTPEGYVEPDYKTKNQQNENKVNVMPEAPQIAPAVGPANYWAAFSGEGNRLDGKKSRLNSTSGLSSSAGSGGLSAAAQAAISRYFLLFNLNL